MGNRIAAYQRSRSRICQVLAIAIATASLRLASAQDIAISGKVHDAAGAPIQGARVELLDGAASTLSAADGSYSLTGKPIAIRVPSSRPASGRLACDAKGFLISAPDAAPIDLRVFRLDGSEAFSARIPSGPSAVRVPFNRSRFGSGPMLLRLSAGAATVTRMLPPVPAEFHLEFAAAPAYGADVPAARNPRATAKSAAALAASLDWLQGSKQGYASHVEGINSYTGTIDITLDALKPPDFGPNTLIFDPTMKMSDIQSQINSAKNKTDAEFGKNRVALLFKPGAYSVDVNIGFYMEVLGLGQVPDDVAITGAVRSKSEEGGDVLTNFWRSAGNLSVTPTVEATNVWGVSQAAPLRRVHIKGSLSLSDGGWSSGGFLADSKVDGTVNAGTQQQWISRNDDLGKWQTNPGSWNFVFLGVTNAPTAPWPGSPHTVADTVPFVREKPFLAIDKAGNYFVSVPDLKKDSKGIGWANGPEAGDSLPIDRFYIAQAATDNATTLNAALAAGKNLFLTPGIYHLSASLNIVRPNTVMLGIGMPTLVPDNGTAALTIADVDGVKVGGMIFEAGPTSSAALLLAGEAVSTRSHAANPTSLHDVFCRVGGASVGTAATCMTLNSNDLIVDHTWLWRADHGAGANWNTNKCKHGLVVNGANVTIYGLFNEHTQEYETLWNGNGGRLYFYQSEMPYDPPSQSAWMGTTPVENGFASYKVADSVTTHQASGMGVYSNFSDAPIIAVNAVETPTGPGIKMTHMMTLWLNGNPSSQISHVYNGAGPATTQGSRAQHITGP